MKKSFVFFGVLSGLLLILFGAFNPSKEQQLTDDIVALVDDHPILKSDLDLALMDAEIQNGQFLNIEAILLQLSAMKATHGEGKMYASLMTQVNFEKAFSNSSTYFPIV